MNRLSDWFFGARGTPEELLRAEKSANEITALRSHKYNLRKIWESLPEKIRGPIEGELSKVEEEIAVKRALLCRQLVAASGVVMHVPVEQERDRLNARLRSITGKL